LAWWSPWAFWFYTLRLREVTLQSNSHNHCIQATPDCALRFIVAQVCPARLMQGVCRLI
jgi:hypothetical protein